MSAARKPAAPRKSTARRPRAKASPQIFSLRGLTSPEPWGSGFRIGPDTAIQVTAILACVRFLAQSIASMPGHVMRTLPNGRKDSANDLPVSYVLRKKPNNWQSFYEWVELTVYHAALHGNAYSRILPGERGFCSELRPIHPTRVEPIRLSDYSVAYKVLEADGQWRTYDASKILHVRWLSDSGLVGMVPAELCATSVALARKLDTAATAFWDNSARPDLVLETTQAIPAEAVTELRRQLREVYGGASKRGSAAALPKGVTMKTIDSNSNEANQFMELRKSIVPDVARAYGVPSTLIGDSDMARWSNVEQEFLTAQVFCLLPWQKRIEGAIDRTILSTYQEQGDDVYYKLDNRGLLRGDTAARVQLMQFMANTGAITPNEIRDLEDFPLLDEPAADETFIQLGFSTLSQAAAHTDAPSTSTLDTAAPAAQADGAVIDPTADPLAAATTGANLAATALNGAQVTALLEVLAKISDGTLDKDAAVALITSAFPTIAEDFARQMVDGANIAPPQATPQGGP